MVRTDRQTTDRRQTGNRRPRLCGSPAEAGPFMEYCFLQMAVLQNEGKGSGQPVYQSLATPVSLAAFATAAATVFPTLGSKALGMI